MPGTSVERNTNTCGVSLVAQRRARSRAARRSIARWSWLPLAADGVPTQTSEISLLVHGLRGIVR